MTKRMIPADVAMLKVLEAWHVKNLYGYPAGSLNSLMNALDYEKHRIRFIQVRHEQVGALAASAHAKLTHRIGVAFGSAGPGAVNMLNGLYDAKADHAPVLAIVGQANSYDLNYNAFQEFSEVPIFSDVACYDRTVMNARSIPHVIDRAIQSAYYYQSVAVVIIPNDLGFVKIPDRKYDSAPKVIKNSACPVINRSEVEHFLRMVGHAKRPVFHVGPSIAYCGKTLVKLAHRLQIPIMIDGTAQGLVPGTVANAGTGNRITSKVTNEIVDTTDLIINLGGEFALPHRFYDHHPFKYIQVDSHRNRIGYHHPVDLGIWTDPVNFVKTLLKVSQPMNHQPYYSAVVADIQNEARFKHHLAVSRSNPITPAQVYLQINRIAEPNAVFSVDIGDNTVNSFRYLKLNQHNRLVFSAHFATMGCSIPGAIAAKLDDPERQVFSIAGDGALSMVMQDLVTERKYHLPIVNVVTSNESTNYIKSQQTDLAMKSFGVSLSGQNFAMIGKGMGIPSINVTRFKQLAAAFDRALKITHNGQPVLINVAVTNQRSLPMEKLHVIFKHHQWQETAEGYPSPQRFFDHYHGQLLKTLPSLMVKFAKYR